MAKKENADIPASKTVNKIFQILKEEGYIDNLKRIEDKKQGVLRIYLKYIRGKSAIRNLSRVSRPGLRAYVKKESIPHVLRGRGIAIVTTSKGIMTDNQARLANLGGEVIAYIW